MAHKLLSSSLISCIFHKAANSSYSSKERTLQLIMINGTTNNSTAPPLFPAPHPQSPDISPLTVVLCLIAVIITPLLIYTIFIVVKCHRNPFGQFDWSSNRQAVEVSCKGEKLELVCGVKYRKEANAKETAGNECPVCLSAFVEGEEIRQLNACKHSFHVACIDMWLCSHSNCPVCRASVPVKRFKRASIGGDEDFRQGLPDAANLI